MTIAPLFLFKNCVEYVPIKDITKMIPKLARGIYTLYTEDKKGRMNCVYVGMAPIGKNSGAGARLLKHIKNKSGLWTHCSVFEAWDNISNAQIRELEGIIRHIYANDMHTNRLNRQKIYKPISRIRRKNRTNWQGHPSTTA
jgi:hypothetical protein